MRDRTLLGAGVECARSSGAAGAAELRQAFLKRGKNDAANAEAICEAVTRPNMRSVPMRASGSKVYSSRIACGNCLRSARHIGQWPAG